MVSFLQTGIGGSSLIFIMGMLAIFFLFIILPQVRRTRREKRFQRELKKGMKVITTSGIHGRVMDLGHTTITLETMAGKIVFERSAISLDATERLNAGAEK